MESAAKDEGQGGLGTIEDSCTSYGDGTNITTKELEGGRYCKTVSRGGRMSRPGADVEGFAALEKDVIAALANYEQPMPILRRESTVLRLLKATSGKVRAPRPQE